MKTLSTRNVRIVAVFIAVMFGVTMISSTALCRGWYSPRRGCGPSFHGRLYVGGSAVPAIIATGIVAGITFSLLNNAASAPASQRPVTPPSVYYGTTSVTSYTAATGSVIVTAPMLNVRSGPGLENPAVLQIPNGSVLSVEGNAPGWYYVKTAGNLYGWVMVQYTAPLGYSAAG